MITAIMMTTTCVVASLLTKVKREKRQFVFFYILFRDEVHDYQTLEGLINNDFDKLYT